jgi:hypothetical protein
MTVTQAIDRSSRGTGAAGKGSTMRVIRNGLGALGMAAALWAVAALGALALMPSPAFAAAASVSTQLSIGQVELGPLGASVSLPIVFTCDPTLNVAFGDASVTEVSGHKLEQGSGSFTNNFPGVPCTGASETITVPVNAFGALAFKHGTKATASVDLTLFDPVAGNLSTTSLTGQAITITK